MHQKSILFDLDGTLTDSGEGIIKCMAVTLEHFGLPVPSNEELRVIVGPPLDQSFMRFGIAAKDIDEALQVYRKRYTTLGKFENFPYPGIRELLSKLKSQGFRLFVATSKPEPVSTEILEHFGMHEYFEEICGAALDKSRNTKSAVIAYLLGKTGNMDAVMVGDTEYDVLGAKAHGIPTIGVAWGYGDIAAMEEAGAVAIAQDMDHLYRLITEVDHGSNSGSMC